MFETWKEWMKQATTAITDWLQQEKRSFSDIAKLIQQHSDTWVTERTWLGLTYRFYFLKIGNTTLSMETRLIGEETKKEHILFICISSAHASPMVYRSYDEKSSLDNIVKVPPLLTQNAAPM
ncbi:hypothetical protein [Thermaerobacillus caldiproteolyticus]|uniref:Uncharacterized protein n=1 Tax=Thermaerobacillus caldiproteolyticus TaxID=247480 RepID=A0A7W0C0M2_9BACL|nr:hypothetical protein [Anoxybacillus caldiproteolyticus]MBA2875514.1 hypothetical protein [Anoxybacillus caldiproteolyticus]